MTVAVNDLLVGPVIPTIGVSLISIDFYFELAAHLEVYKDGSETALVVSTDYTVSLPTAVGATDGSITLVVAADGANSYAIYGQQPLERSTDLQFRGDLRSPVLNLELDRIWRGVQGIDTAFSRTLQFSKNSNVPAPLETLTTASRQNKVIGFNADGTGLQVGPTVDEISSAQSYAVAAAASLDSFDDRNLGAKSADPTFDNDGNALTVGSEYFNTAVNEMRVWTGSLWLSTLYNSANVAITGGTIVGTTFDGVSATSRTAAIALGLAANEHVRIEGTSGGVFQWLSGDQSALIVDAAKTTTAVDAATETMTLADHGYLTGQAVLVTSPPTGLAVNTLYYVIATEYSRADAGGAFNSRNKDEFKLATSFANAIAGTAVDITGTTNFNVIRHNDPLQGIWVAPSSDLSGASGTFARVRFSYSDYDIRWFGAVEVSDIFNAAQATIFAAEASWFGSTTASINTFAGRGVWFPSGVWELSGRLKVYQGGVTLYGDGRNLTTVHSTVNTVGCLEFEHENHDDGQFIHRSGVQNMQFYSSAHVFNANDIAVTFTQVKYAIFDNVKIEDFSVFLRLKAAQEPFHISKCVFWQSNASMVASSMLQVRVSRVAGGTAGAKLDLDTNVTYEYCSMIFMDNTEFRTDAGMCDYPITINSVDGFKATNCHVLGGDEASVLIDPVSHICPIANVVFSGCFDDGIGGTTKRNLYIKNRTYATANANIKISYYNHKFNDALVNAFLSENVDVTLMEFKGCVFDKVQGTQVGKVSAGKGTFIFTDNTVLYGTGGPTSAGLALVGNGASFFKRAYIKGNIFDHDDTATALPAQHIVVTDNGSNTCQLNVTSNDWISDGTIVFVKHNFAAGGTFTITQTGNAAITYP